MFHKKLRISMLVLIFTIVMGAVFLGFEKFHNNADSYAAKACTKLTALSESKYPDIDNYQPDLFIEEDFSTLPMWKGVFTHYSSDLDKWQKQSRPIIENVRADFLSAAKRDSKYSKIATDFLNLMKWWHPNSESKYFPTYVTLFEKSDAPNWRNKAFGTMTPISFYTAKEDLAREWSNSNSALGNYKKLETILDSCKIITAN